MTLRELCNRYLATIQNQAPATVSLKTNIIGRLLAELPDGADAQVAKIRQSSLEAWLAKYKFGYSSHNHYAHALKALFDIAVNDAIILQSPAAKIESTLQFLHVGHHAEASLRVGMIERICDWRHRLHHPRFASCCEFKEGASTASPGRRSARIRRLSSVAWRTLFNHSSGTPQPSSRQRCRRCGSP